MPFAYRNNQETVIPGEIKKRIQDMKNIIGSKKQMR